MKVCFICLDNLMKLPYLYKYTSVMKCKYDMIYWNRQRIDEKREAENHYSMEYTMPPHSRKIIKLIGYLRFRKFAIKIIKKQKYDMIVLLNSTVGVLLGNALVKDYKGKYIVDVRDYSYEHIKLFRQIEKKLIDNSNSTVISSPGYKRFLPPHKYYLVHNIPNLSNDKMENYQKKREEEVRKRKIVKDERIYLSYIGDVRFVSQDKKVLDYFGNDDRYFVSYIGLGTGVLKEYAQDKHYSNVNFLGMFDPSEILDLYVDADAVLNLYGNHTPLLDYALSNKLYYAALLALPILVCADTYMEKISTEYGFGFTIDVDDGGVSKREFHKYFKHINKEELRNNCNRFVDTVFEDEKSFNKHFNNVFGNKLEGENK